MNGRLYSYVVRDDTGLAPNPFWGSCTLAVCTPNHQGSRVEIGDWIAGFLAKERGHRFLYAMEVSEILDLDDYYQERRYEKKKPDLRGDWKARCGDNFYSRRDDGSWIQHRNRFHLDEKVKAKDTKFAIVFIGEKFWYLGRSAEKLPDDLRPLAGGRGARVNHDPILVTKFCSWVSENFSTGIANYPNDNPDLNSTGEWRKYIECHRATR